MQVWRGWMATVPTACTKMPTWAEWCARQQRVLRDEQCQQQGLPFLPFSEREMARLSFVRWLCQTGHLDAREHDDI